MLELVFGFLGIAAAGTVGAGVIHRVLTNNRDPAWEVNTVGSLLCWEGLDGDGMTVVMRDKSLCQIVAISGMNMSQKDRTEIETLSVRFAAALGKVLDSGGTLRLLGTREPVQVETGAGYQHPVLSQIHAKWSAPFRLSYSTRRYALICFPKGASVGKVAETTKEFVEGLRAFDPVILQGSDVIEWFGDRLDLVDGGVKADPAAFASAVSVGCLEVDFGSGSVVVRSGSRSVHSRVVSAVEWADQDAASIVDGLLALPGRVDVCMLVQPVSKITQLDQLASMRRQQQLRRMNPIVAEEFDQFSNLVQAGEALACVVSVWAVLSDVSVEGVEALTAEAKTHLKSYGLKPIVETDAAAYLWLARLPGRDQAVRPRWLHSVNVGRLFQLARVPEGARKSSWGDGPIRYFRTLEGAPYRLQFHTTDKRLAPGHFVMFAPTGGGKTVLAQHLIGGAMRHRGMTVLAFDRFLGMRVWCEAVGGRYLNPLERSSVAFNPFALEGDVQDRTFLRSMLLQLAGLDGAEYIEAADRSLEKIFKVNKGERYLPALDTAFENESLLKAGMQRWIKGDGMAGVFSAPRDSFDVDSGLIIIDNTQLLDDAAAAAAVVQYAMYMLRRAAMAGRPHLIFVDETKPQMEVPVFAANLKVAFREHRKLDGVVGVVFQDPGGLLEHPMSKVITDACRTRFFLPNPDLNEADASAIGLSRDELAFVRGDHRAYSRLRRPFLFKNGAESVILDADMSALGSMFRLYEGGPEPAATARRLRDLHGDSWVDVLTGGDG